MVGIFDSGVGGLSVLREIVKILPQEDYIYFADNAHCPYGEKSQEYVIGRAEWISELLIREGAEIIVVACNTATAAAIATLRERYSDNSSSEVRERVMELSGDRQDHVCFIGMEPAVKPAALSTKSGVIGVLATAGTLKGGKYTSTRDQYAHDVKVVEHVGRGFVELVEGGNTSGPEAEKVVAASLKPLLDADADTIVLGCTHYPFLKKCIEKTARAIAPGRAITIIDPAPAVARHLTEVMGQEGLMSGKPQNKKGSPDQTKAKAALSGAGQTSIRLLSSGDPALLQKMAGKIFPDAIFPEATFLTDHVKNPII